MMSSSVPSHKKQQLAAVDYVGKVPRPDTCNKLTY